MSQNKAIKRKARYIKMNSVNNELLSGIYKLSKTGIEAVETVLPKVEQGALKEELTEQYGDYCKAASDSENALLQNGVVPKDIGLLQKAGMWSSVQMHTINDTSSDHIAEIMITGTTKGIIDLTKHIGACKNADKDIIDYANGFISKEQKHIDNLKAFLQ